MKGSRLQSKPTLMRYGRFAVDAGPTWGTSHATNTTSALQRHGVTPSLPTAACTVRDTVWVAQRDGSIVIRTVDASTPCDVVRVLPSTIFTVSLPGASASTSTDVYRTHSTMIAAMVCVGGVTVWVATAEGKVHLFDAPTLRRVHEGKHHSGAVTCLHLSPDGLEMYSGGIDGRVVVWNAEDGFYLRSHHIGMRGVRCLQRVSRVLYCGTEDGFVVPLTVSTESHGSDATSSPPRSAVGAPLMPHHNDAVTSMIFFNSQLWSGSADGTIHVRDAYSMVLLRRLQPDGGRVLALIPLGSRVVVHGSNDTLVLFSSELEREVELPQLHPSGSTVLATFVSCCVQYHLWVFGSDHSIVPLQGSYVEAKDRDFYPHTECTLSLWKAQESVAVALDDRKALVGDLKECHAILVHERAMINSLNQKLSSMEQDRRAAQTLKQHNERLSAMALELRAQCRGALVEKSVELDTVRSAQQRMSYSLEMFAERHGVRTRRKEVEEMLQELDPEVQLASSNTSLADVIPLSPTQGCSPTPAPLAPDEEIARLKKTLTVRNTVIDILQDRLRRVQVPSVAEMQVENVTSLMESLTKRRCDWEELLGVRGGVGGSGYLAALEAAQDTANKTYGALWRMAEVAVSTMVEDYSELVGAVLAESNALARDLESVQRTQQRWREATVTRANENAARLESELASARREISLYTEKLQEVQEQLRGALGDLQAQRNQRLEDEQRREEELRQARELAHVHNNDSVVRELVGRLQGDLDRITTSRDDLLQEILVVRADYDQQLCEALKQRSDLFTQVGELEERHSKALDEVRLRCESTVRELEDARHAADDAAAKQQCLMEAHAALKVQLHTAWGTCDESKAAYSDMESKHNTVVQRLAAAQQELEGLRSEHDDAMSRRLTDTSLLRQQLHSCTAQVEQLTGTVSELELKLTARTGEASAVRQLNQTLTSELEQTRVTVEELESKLAKRTVEAASWKQQLQSLQTELEVLRAVEDTSAKQRQTLTVNAVSDLEIMLTQKTAEVASAKQQTYSLQSERDGLFHTVEDLEQRLAKKTQEVSALRTQVQATQAELEKQLDVGSDLHSKWQAAQHETVRMREELRSAQAAVDDARRDAALRSPPATPDAHNNNNNNTNSIDLNVVQETTAQVVESVARADLVRKLWSVFVSLSDRVSQSLTKIRKSDKYKEIERSPSSPCVGLVHELSVVFSEVKSCLETLRFIVCNYFTKTEKLSVGTSSDFFPPTEGGRLRRMDSVVLSTTTVREQLVRTSSSGPTGTSAKAVTVAIADAEIDSAVRHALHQVPSPKALRLAGVSNSVPNSPDGHHHQGNNNTVATPQLGQPPATLPSTPLHLAGEGVPGDMSRTSSNVSSGVKGRAGTATTMSINNNNNVTLASKLPPHVPPLSGSFGTRTTAGMSKVIGKKTVPAKK